MIYLDNNATTKIDWRVYLKQCKVLHNIYGNPSSFYSLGLVAKSMIEEARKQVATFINADLSSGDKIIFTSGATESNNAVFYSVMQPNTSNKHIVISSVEHSSVSVPANYYSSIGCSVTRVSVDSDGKLCEEQLFSAINENTVLVSIMLVNSETGIIHNVERFSRKIKSINGGKILIHTDAVQAAGKIPIDVKKLGIDALTISGHKLHGPKGVGVLYIKSGVPFVPYIMGGSQEYCLRAGTENIASIVAMGYAASISNNFLKTNSMKRIEDLRDAMESKLAYLFPDSLIYGKNIPRIGNTTNIGFNGVIGHDLVLQLAQAGICVSSGTACSYLRMEPSSVLIAMNAPEKYIRSIRISLSRENTQGDIETLIKSLHNIVRK